MMLFSETAFTNVRASLKHYCKKSSMEGELTCPICLQIYQDPVVMSCMHSYCRECLKDLHVKSTTAEESWDTRLKTSNTLPCPACRAITSFGLEGVDGLPKNFTLASICRKFKETFRQPPALASDETCKQTPSNEKSVYCKACQVIVRSGDLLPTHRYHVTEDLKTELRKQQVKLSTCLQELERSRTKEEARLKAASVDHCNRQEQMQKQEDAINSLAESIEERVQSRKKEVLEKLKSLKTHNKTSFEAYQKQLQSYISTVDSITAAAHTIGDQRLEGEEGQVGFLQVVDDVLTQTQRLARVDDLTSCLGMPFPAYGEEFAGNLRADFTALFGPSLDPTKTTLAASNEDISTVHSQEEVSTDEEVVAAANHNVIQDHSQEEDATDEEVVAAESETGYFCWTPTYNVIEGANFEWDPYECSSSLAICEDRLLVTDERWQDEEIRGECANNSGNWRNVRGIASHIILQGKNLYWEILVTFAILSHLNDKDLITDLGICKPGKEDVYSPLRENYYCLCCSLIKDPVSANIVMEFWDGPKKTTWETHTVKKRIRRRKKEHLKLGFNVDFLNKMFRIIDVDENAVLHNFVGMDFSSVTAVASIENGDKVRTSLELDSNVCGLPFVLWN
ncbi:tripartite motif-containing protein 54-like [Haliotis rubra]|uniref:tripartite motif-containing protein 54-like n=1 Tax=Haliotis rubra TaxID=36100 RepID=UPI001EE54554|nr:tripartite motif-containing protein 54-like [Haliotis rubra]